jgi:hypothetical protein
MAKRDEWIWMPHAAHLVVANRCLFHLATCVGNYIVSTVGEYLPDETAREIHCQSLGIVLNGKGDERRADFLEKVGYVEVGLGRKYETMVFPAKKSDEQCCPYEAASWNELDLRGYNDPGEAYQGHLEICQRYSEMELPEGG